LPAVLGQIYGSRSISSFTTEDFDAIRSRTQALYEVAAWQQSARTALVCAARGLTKSLGERIRGRNPMGFGSSTTEELGPQLQVALAPMLSALEAITARIREYNVQIETLAEQSYPEVALLRQVKGVGTLIALTYVPTLEDPRRFRKSRDAACRVSATAPLGLPPLHP
jgi:transposase